MKVQIPDFLDASGMELIPQSITTAPGLIHSPGTKLDLPIATTTISAVLTIEPKSFVLEWQTVTVQCFHFNNSDIGVPTILLLPKIVRERCHSQKCKSIVFLNFHLEIKKPKKISFI